MLLRHRPQGLGLLPVPQPRAWPGVDRVLRAAGVHRRPRGRRHAGGGVPGRRRRHRRGRRRGRRGRRGRDPHRLHRVRRMLTQSPIAKRIAPLVVEESEEEAPGGLPAGVRVRAGAEELLDALLPKYVNTRIYAALLESAASESASRRRAMKSATRQRRRADQDATPARPTRPGRPRSPRRSARSSAARTRSPSAARATRSMTAVDAAGPPRADTATGRVVRVIGPVVDVEFPATRCPS